MPRLANVHKNVTFAKLTISKLRSKGPSLACHFHNVNRFCYLLTYIFNSAEVIPFSQLIKQLSNN